MTRYVIILGCFICLVTGCLREKYRGDDCRREVAFVMKDVPYVFVNDEAIAYRPYYTFVELLNVYVFADERLEQSSGYGFSYCREHPVISRQVDYNSQTALFVVNLYDPKELNWSFRDEKLVAVFSILDYEEPPVLLSAIADLRTRQDSIPVELQMLVSRIEIRLINPPLWITGLDITVRNVAASVSTDFVLGDTTHINKQLFFDNQGPGSYQFGVNTFPTYSGKAALVSITPTGTSEASPIVVVDDRLHLLPGVITLIDIEYDRDENITVSVEIDGKWEIVDGGNIII